MTAAIRFFLPFVSLIGLAIFGAAPAKAQGFGGDKSTSNVSVTLKSSMAAVKPGETFFVVIEQKIARGWHTYWRNPGDSGEPTDISWTLPQGVSAGPIKWPAPSALPFGPLVNYGYSDQVALPVEIKVHGDAVIGTTLELAGEVRWLECADICIPGSAPVNVAVKIEETGRAGSDSQLVKEAVSQLPARFAGDVRLTDLGSGGLQLIVKGVDTPRSAYFFPYEIKLGAVVDFAQPQDLVRGKDGFGLNLVKSPSFPADLKGPIGGVLVLNKGSAAKAYEIDASFEFAPSDSAAARPAANLAPGAPIKSIGLLVALGLAFLGGLILNLMPCVFPILSMKALGLVEASHGEAKAARAHGLWYGAGVILSFLALAGILIGASAAGAAIGWGFQLQSPAIVIVLAVLMVLIGFNLMGFFEIGTSLQNVGGSLAGRAGASGSFFTGMLAVIVAAPCTAPFMGAALGYAATQAAPIALLVFASLGVGFAVPFVALTFMPRLLSKLPKPGAWTTRLREALAFPMFGTAIWLIWVASAQAGQSGILAALICVLAAGFAIWLSRTWTGLVGKGIAFAALLGTLVWAGFYVTDAQSRATSSNAPLSFGEAWSPEKVAQLQSEGKTVFVNFTADWCVTCKVNEVGALSDERVRAAFSNGKAVYLIADWTNRNDAIAKALASHGRVGVPLYLVYKEAGKAPAILPQILTPQTLLDAIQ